MFSIAFRYIFKRLLTTFLMVAPVVILMAWVTMSIKYIGLIVSDNLSFWTFFKLVLCILPGVCGIILPICFLISSIIAIQSLQNSKEIIVLMTSGKSALSIFAPLLTLGFLISATVLYVQTSGSPNAYKSFESIKEQIKTQISINLLPPQKFNVIGESVIYVGARVGNELQNIFVSYIPKNATSNTNIITAKSGSFIASDEGAFIQLENGCRQEFDKANDVVATLKFQILSYDVTPFFKRLYSKSSTVNYQTQTELIKEAEITNDENHKRNCLAEYHSRILNSNLPILNALIIGMFLIAVPERGHGRTKSILAFLLGTICHASVMVLLNTATKNSFMIPCNYAIMTVVMLLLFSVFIKKRN